ncbi:hypothetical protein [Fructobacillus cardui]|uniref:hypothetical protein n=1 Tax=Fructobacillus cardui TaxID=2893170 RepID=UPI0030C7D6E9
MILKKQRWEAVFRSERGPQLVSTELSTRQGLPGWFHRKSGKGALFFATPLILKGAFSNENTEKIINEEDAI